MEGKIKNLFELLEEPHLSSELIDAKFNKNKDVYIEEFLDILKRDLNERELDLLERIAYQAFLYACEEYGIDDAYLDRKVIKDFVNSYDWKNVAYISVALAKEIEDNV